MGQIKAGSVVSIHYIGTLDNGRIFDSRSGDDPLLFTVGAHEVFPALEQAVIGMKVGEVRNILVAAKDAYGPRLQENILRLPRNSLGPQKGVKVGRRLNLEFGGGDRRIMTVSEVTETSVTLDGNHPLAGFDLTFALRLDAVLGK